LRPGARRLTLVIGSLGSGGAERVLTILANVWAARGDAVTLVTLDRETPFYPLDERVAYRPLGVAGLSSGVTAAIVNNVRRIRALREAVRESGPDVVVSFIETTNVLTLLATRGLNIPVIVSERSDPAHFPTGRAIGVLRRWLYPRADVVIVQTVGAGRFFSPRVQRRLRVIPNPVLPDPEGTIPASAVEKRIVALGRLSKVKGFDLLIEAFAQLAATWPEWSLEIWGEGAERTALESLVKTRGLQNRIRLPGQTPTPQLVLRGAGLFVLPSRVEGFPNALCEAMAAGVAVLAADCASGPRDIVRDGVDGLLVLAGGSSALAEGMSRLLGDETLRSRLARRAPEIVKRFALENVIELWDRVLSEASVGRGSSG
jgi:GalNAc-alpha-(1->4)-GalNAc-alpha-(1->3)-diNAcBac-PP-undecaprenol alpha-1,4-N-acetyl-D-galactosaminyltransferase